MLNPRGGGGSEMTFVFPEVAVRENGVRGLQGEKGLCPYFIEFVILRSTNGVKKMEAMKGSCSAYPSPFSLKGSEKRQDSSPGAE